MPEPRRWTLKNGVVVEAPIPYGESVEVVESSALDAAQARIAELEREQAQRLAALDNATHEGMAWKDRAEQAELAIDTQATRIAGLKRERDEARKVAHAASEEAALARYLMRGKGDPELEAHVANMVNTATARAETAEAALAAQAWVPCSERMPEVHEVLSDADVYEVTVDCGDYRIVEQGVLYCESGFAYANSGTIIAWRPLPAPWEGDKA